MATINITQDRGLAIFAPQQTGPEGEPRPSRLMGLVCMVRFADFPFPAAGCNVRSWADGPELPTPARQACKQHNER